MSVVLEVRLGRVLRAHRERLKFTRAGLARIARVSASSIERVENGEVSATVETLRRLCAALDLAPWSVMREAWAGHDWAERKRVTREQAADKLLSSHVKRRSYAW